MTKPAPKSGWDKVAVKMRPEEKLRVQELSFAPAALARAEVQA
jgi:hypothetical protein